jgi:hypothetical protein
VRKILIFARTGARLVTGEHLSRTPRDRRGGFCEGFRMTAHRDVAAGTGAVVGKPPWKEPAGSFGAAVPRAMGIWSRRGG